MKESANKFLARVRDPRTKICLDVHENGAIKKMEIPFVMGVLADLAGKPETPQDDLHERKFVDFTVHTFDQKMAEMRPRAAFMVESKIPGKEGSLPVDLTFEKMADFSPEQIARKVPELSELLKRREEIANLLNLTSGKVKVNQWLGKALQQIKQQTGEK